jgi:nucleoside-diphosphate-sugar epimerase
MTAPRAAPKAFVTGATGAIGSALTERLSREGWRVNALARRPESAAHLEVLSGVTIVSGDLEDNETLIHASAGCDTVFHLAALVHADPSTPEAEFTRVNVAGTGSLVDAAITAGAKRLVFFSSVAVYPETDAVTDEESQPQPQTAYGRSKLEGEELALSRDGEIEVVVLRLPVVYGPRDRGNVIRLVRAIRRGRFAIVGDGTNLKTMVGLDNVVDAALLVATHPRAPGRIFIVCDERDYSQIEIATTIAELLGRRASFPRVPRAPMLLLGRIADLVSAATRVQLPLTSDRVRKLSMSTQHRGDRIRRELGFTPRHTLREGLEQVIASLRD